MSILLKQIRIHGFRGLENIEMNLEPTTILVGANNSGKTTFLKALQLALSNTITVSADDFFYCADRECDKIIIDLLFIPTNEKLEAITEFSDDWFSVLTENRIVIDEEGGQTLSFRTLIEEDQNKKIFRKKQYLINEWGEFEDSSGFWYERQYDTDFSFYFDELPFYYIDANRDILDDLKSKTSYLGKLLSTIEYDPTDKAEIEGLIEELNKITIEKSDVLVNLSQTLGELDTAMDNPNNSVDITPFTKKLRDLNKGVQINYSQFSMDYHGMGTRSWSSLLIIKSFLNYYSNKYVENEKVYFPILAVEEPESHLHPNAQKKLYSQIKAIAGQKIISTHSNYIAGNAELLEIRSLKNHNNEVLIGQIDNNLFTKEQLRKIKRQVINTRGELFFSKAVVLFEGETEEQVLPILIEKYFGMSFVELGVDFIGVGGSGNYTPYINFCESFNIIYFIFSDNEAEANKEVKKQIKNSKNNDLNSVVFLHNGNDFEKELIEQGYLDEVKEAYKNIELSECFNEKHTKAKEKELTKIKDEEYYDLIVNMKTKFASEICHVLLKSKKELPLKIKELFDKINATLNLGQNGTN